MPSEAEHIRNNSIPERKLTPPRRAIGGSAVTRIIERQLVEREISPIFVLDYAFRLVSECEAETLPSGSWEVLIYAETDDSDNGFYTADSNGSDPPTVSRSSVDPVNRSFIWIPIPAITYSGPSLWYIETGGHYAAGLSSVVVTRVDTARRWHYYDWSDSYNAGVLEMFVEGDIRLASPFRDINIARGTDDVIAGSPVVEIAFHIDGDVGRYEDNGATYNIPAGAWLQLAAPNTPATPNATVNPPAYSNAGASNSPFTFTPLFSGFYRFTVRFDAPAPVTWGASEMLLAFSYNGAGGAPPTKVIGRNHCQAAAPDCYVDGSTGVVFIGTSDSIEFFVSHTNAGAQNFTAAEVEISWERVGTDGAA